MVVLHSYFTALQAPPDMALQPIVSGRYHDRFARRDGNCRFVERRVQTDLVGEVSRHLRDCAQPVALSQTTDELLLPVRTRIAQQRRSSTRFRPSAALGPVPPGRWTCSARKAGAPA
jgi:hypothetical protein